MRDVDDGRAELAADAQDLELERLAELLVEGAQRLVHQQQPRPEHDGPGERDALLLPAGQLARIAVAEGPELDELQRLRDPLRCSDRGTLAHLERERDVLGGGHVREQRVVLEHHPDVAAVGRHRGVISSPVDLDRALVRGQEARRSSAGSWSCPSPTARAA